MPTNTLLLIFILILVYAFVQLIIGSFLLARMIKTKLYNLLGLILFFILNALQLILLYNLPYHIYIFTINWSLVFLLIFIQLTFYRERKSPFKIILGLFIVIRILEIIIRVIFIGLDTKISIPQLSPLSESQIPIYYIFAVVITIENAIPSLWLAYITLTTYKSLKNQDIEPWVIKRYLIIGYSSCFFVLFAFLCLLMPYEGGFETPYGLLIGIFFLISILIFTLGNLIGWVMPERLKLYLNRGYQPSIEQELSEVEIMEKIKSKLSQRRANGNN